MKIHAIWNFSMLANPEETDSALQTWRDVAVKGKNFKEAVVKFLEKYPNAVVSSMYAQEKDEQEIIE